jgi:hypothetical protein
MVGEGIAPLTATTESIPHTTPLSQPSPQFVTITHPYHPRHGERVKLTRVCRGADPDLTVQLSDGLHVVVAMSWTDYATPQGAEHPSTPPHLLDFNGLRQAAQLIDHIRQDGRFPPDESKDRTCPPAHKGYD